jgi:hypothetical protein
MSGAVSQKWCWTVGRHGGGNGGGYKVIEACCLWLLVLGAQFT